MHAVTVKDIPTSLQRRPSITATRSPSPSARLTQAFPAPARDAAEPLRTIEPEVVGTSGSTNYRRPPQEPRHHLGWAPGFSAPPPPSSAFCGLAAGDASQNRIFFDSNL